MGGNTGYNIYTDLCTFRRIHSTNFHRRELNYRNYKRVYLVGGGDSDRRIFGISNGWDIGWYITSKTDAKHNDNFELSVFCCLLFAGRHVGEQRYLACLFAVFSRERHTANHFQLQVNIQKINNYN